jgi:hypothetical protein
MNNFIWISLMTLSALDRMLFLVLRVRYVNVTFFNEKIQADN